MRSLNAVPFQILQSMGMLLGKDTSARLGRGDEKKATTAGVRNRSQTRRHPALHHSKTSSMPERSSDPSFTLLFAPSFHPACRPASTCQLDAAQMRSVKGFDSSFVSTNRGVQIDSRRDATRLSMTRIGHVTQCSHRRAFFVDHVHNVQDLFLITAITLGPHTASHSPIDCSDESPQVSFE